MPPFEPLYIRLEPVLNVSYPQVDKMSQVLHEIGVPLRVIEVLPLDCLIPGVTKRCKWRFVVKGVWPREHESRFCILRSNYKVRVEVLALLVGRTAAWLNAYLQWHWLGINFGQSSLQCIRQILKKPIRAVDGHSFLNGNMRSGGFLKTRRTYVT